MRLGAVGRWNAADDGKFAPVGEVDTRDASVLVSRGEAAVPRLLADKAHYLCALNHRHGESKVLEILAHAEEIACEIVVKQEILDIGDDGIGGLGGVVLEAGAVAHLGVEHLTGGEGYIRFYQVDDVEWHQVGGTPRHICVGVGEDSRRSTVFRRLRSKNLSVLLENRLRLGERRRGVGVG